MFRSQPMYKVELVVPEHDIVAVTEALAASGVFHLARPPQAEQEAADLGPGSWRERANTYARLIQRIADVRDLLGVEEGEPPGGTPHLISEDQAAREIETLEEEARGPVGELEQARERMAQLQRLRSQIEPLTDLGIELETFRSSTYIFSMFGSMPLSNVERLRTSLEHVPSVLVTLDERDRLATVGLFGLRRDSDILRRAARSAYLNSLELPDEYQGTPDEILDRLDRELNETREGIAQGQAAIHHFHETRIRKLRQLLWQVRASRRVAETIAQYERLRYSYVVTGWVPASKAEEFRRLIAEASSGLTIDITEPTPEERSRAPFEYNNPPALRAFQQLVSNYALPRYEELDPTPLLALTFPLIFGVMFGDVGHGFVLVVLGALLLSGRIRALKSFSGLGGIAVACGVVSAAFGFLYGSLFGFEDVIPALWLNPIERTMDVLLATVGFGIAVLTLGMIYNVVGAGIRGQWVDLALDRKGLAGLAFYWSLIGLGAGLLTSKVPVSMGLLVPVAVVSALAVVVHEPLARVVYSGGEEDVDVGLALLEGFFELFEAVIGLLSNTLSYVRMGAFAVAHGALSLVVFILARRVGSSGSPAYWATVVLGNVLVIGFEGLIVVIQTLRLEYYELFDKFFSGGGEQYQPLTLLGAEQRP
ncbi:MAG: V-type ATP synthase subunit I [Anaerolineae bacterium]